MARPFHFKLEKILEYRRQVEDQAKLALAKAQQAAQEQTSLLARLASELQQCLHELSRTKQLTQADLWLWSGYKDRLVADKNSAEQTLAKLESLAEACRQELVSKSMERKLLEKLREKQAAKYEQDAQQREQKEFDETATLRYGRTPY